VLGANKKREGHALTTDSVNPLYGFKELKKSAITDENSNMKRLEWLNLPD